MSGTSRQYTVLPPQTVLLDRPVRITPGPTCHDGLRKTVETPPPPPPLAKPCPPQTLTWNGPVVRVVPPTPVAQGWPAGSSPSRPLNPTRWQSDEPSSPEATKNDMPATAGSR